MIFSFISWAYFSFQAGWALELPVKNYFFCLRQKAIAVESRTIRVQEFPEKENFCAVIYSVKGQDKIVAQGRWLAFCEKAAKKLKTRLQQNLWKCNQKTKVQVFYSSS